jgi:hypothetical protein
MLRAEDIEGIYDGVREKLNRLEVAGLYGATRAMIDSALADVTSLQRKIELLVEDVRKLDDEKTRFYVNRCMKNLNAIRFGIEDFNSGVLQNITRQSYQSAVIEFYEIKIPLLAILEDIKLIQALRVYPIEEKVELKSQLSDNGFVEVVKCLDEAECNIAENNPSHRKDIVDRSREAIDKFVATTLTKEGRKPSDMFNTDIGTFSGLGIISKEEKKIVEATWSYLSEAGPHGRKGELTLGDVNFAVRDTYVVIDLLLKRYCEFKNKGKQGKNFVKVT